MANSPEKLSPPKPTAPPAKTGRPGNSVPPLPARDSSPSPPSFAAAPARSPAKTGQEVPPSAPPRKRKPFPWPLLLALAIPPAFGGLLAWEWSQQDPILMGRTLWVGLCSVVPGLFVMVVLGSLAQILRRPILSSLSLILGGGAIYGCYVAFHFVILHAESFLK